MRPRTSRSFYQEIFCDVCVLHRGTDGWDQNGLPPRGQGRPNVGRRAIVIEDQT
jgi:hypothetical protein